MTFRIRSSFSIECNYGGEMGNFNLWGRWVRRCPVGYVTVEVRRCRLLGSGLVGVGYRGSGLVGVRV